MQSKLPPMLSNALPFVGHVVEFARNRDAVFERGYRQHSGVFAINLLGKPIAVVTGAAHNKLFYSETDKSLNMSEAYVALEAAFGELLFTAGEATYQNQRPVLQALFRHDKMAKYVAAMRVEVQRWLAALPDEGKMNISREMLTLAQSVAGHAFIGEGFREEIGEGFWSDYEAISQSIDFLIPPHLPLPRNIRRDRAKLRMRAIFAELVARRKANPEQYDDLITHVLTTPLKDGTFMSEDEIGRLFIGLLFAGHETTAGQAGWTIIHLLQHPDYLRRVQDEIAQHVTPDMDARSLSKLEHLYWAIDETTRLRPSADVQMRMVKTDLQVDDYTIPAGWGVMVNAANSHHQPDVYSNPVEYDPLRYSPERGEGGSPFDIIGFGGGIHKCTGMNFAKNEMAVITMLLLQQFDLQLLSDDVRVMIGKGANRPTDAWVAYRRKAVRQADAQVATATV